MLDSGIKDQLKAVFKALESPIELVYNDSPNQNQGELLEMLNEIAETNSLIHVRKIQAPSPHPRFEVHTQGRPTGVVFTGIPGGHEFSSLIVAILNADGKGKLPDAPIQNRVRQIQGPIRLKTYISLSCENCPEVVQALNQMAFIHGDMTHEMIDGAYAPDEIQRLGIQGVPSVIHGDILIHSGRSDFLSLLTKLEAHFGKANQSPTSTAIDKKGHPNQGSTDLGPFDVVVIGGGPAGVSAAIYSARKGLKTALLAERLGGQVQETKGIENLISVPYTEGPQLAHNLAQHMAAYPIQILEHRRVQSITIENEKKRLSIDSGETLTTPSIIVATGAKWRELGIPGEKEFLGRGVAYCPHCDGPYYKGKKVAVIGGGNSGVEAAIDLAGIVKEVVLLEFQDQLKADQVLVDKLLSLPNTSVITSAKTTGIKGDSQKLTHLEYLDRLSNTEKSIPLDGVFVQIGLLPNSGFIKGLVELNKAGEIIVDEKGRTSTPGIYAAGDVTTTPYKQIIIAMGEGAKAALAAFEDQMLK